MAELTRLQWLAHWVAAGIWLPFLGLRRLGRGLWALLQASWLWRWVFFLGLGLPGVAVIQMVPTWYHWAALRSDVRTVVEHGYGQGVDELRTKLEEVAARHGFPRDPEDLEAFQLDLDHLEDGQERYRVEVRKTKSIRLWGLYPHRFVFHARLKCWVVPFAFKKKGFWEWMGLDL